MARKIALGHLLLAAALLGVLLWRVTVWQRSGWVGMKFAGGNARTSDYSFFPQHAGGRIFGVELRGPADRAGIKSGEKLTAVNGIPTAAESRLRAFSRKSRLGDAVSFQIDQRLQPVTLKLESPLQNSLVVWELIISALVSFFYIAVAGIVIARRPGDRRAVVFDVMSILAALVFFIDGFMRVDRASAIGLATKVHTFFETLAGILGMYLVVLFLHFARIFPRPRPQPHETWRRTVIILYGLPSFLVLTLVADLFAGHWPQGLQMAIGLSQFLGLMVVGFGFTVATLVALHRSYRLSGIEEKRQIRWPVWGMIVAVATPLMLGVVDVNWGMGPADAAEVGLWDEYLNRVFDKLFYLLLPVSFALGIIKYRLMEIDRLIQKTTIYGIVTLVLVTTYLLLTAGLGAILIQTTKVKNEWVIMASTLAVAAILFPVRSRVQSVVERRIFPTRFSHPETLTRLVATAKATHDQRALAQTAAEVVQQACNCRFVLLLLRDRRTAELRVVSKVGLPDETATQVRIPSDRGWLRAFAEPRPVTDLPLDAAEKSLFGKLGASLAVPVRREMKTLGIFLLGDKLDREMYEPEDLSFLASAADALAEGLSRIELHRDAGEIDEARRIQQGLVPKVFPHFDGLEISGTWEPARIVSGDYFDVLELGEGVLGLCIGDVVGKGIPAALLMSNLQATVRAFATSTLTPSELCTRLHRLIRNNVAMGRFVTFFYARFDTRSRELRYCNAGHNPPLLISGDGTQRELETGGPALGAFAQATYHEDGLALRPGDRLVLYTDGVTEAGSLEAEQFGDRRLADLIASHRGSGAVALQEKIVKAVHEFSGDDLQDDVTLLVLAVDEGLT